MPALCNANNKAKANTEVMDVPVRRSPIERMPLDILLEIFSVMHPCGLLPLVRASKAFRAFLTGPNSERIWKASRARVSKDVPERPPHLTETQYTALLFAEHCTGCGKSGITLKVIWVFFGRWCESCVKERQVQVMSGCLWRYVLMRKFRLVTGDTIEDLMAEVKTAMKDGSAHFSYVTTKYYHRLEVLLFKELWMSCKDNEEKRKLVGRRIAVVEEKTKARSALKVFHYASYHQLPSMLTKVGSIINRLKEEGWGPELEWMGSSGPSTLRYRLDGADVVQVLTDAGWGKIRREAITYMGTIRTARLAQQRREAVIKRLTMLRDTVVAYEASLGPRDATSDLRAEFADLAIMPAVRELVGAPTEADIDPEDIDKLQARFPELQNEWRSAREHELASMVWKEVPSAIKDDLSKTSSSVVELAIVSFRCTRCRREGLRWPNILAHKCSRSDYYSFDDQAYGNALSYVCGHYGLMSPWWARCPFRVAFATKDMRAMIRLCGYDPFQATFEELQSSGTRLYCKVCSVPSIGYMEVYNWWNAPTHSRPRCHTGTFFGPPVAVKSAKWTVLDPKHSALVVAVELARRAGGQVPGATVFGCARCRHLNTGIPYSHCERKHGIEDPKVGTDFYVHPETSLEDPPVTIYPDDARTDRTAAKGVKSGNALFSAALFAEPELL
ncbi:hypothetical protein C8Q79DRAFT_910321 [Trametes meyenii]|nr:hypothetical protein C8Q79DRAFT_910321 [Trametes meyenii]